MARTATAASSKAALIPRMKVAKRKTKRGRKPKYPDKSCPICGKEFKFSKRVKAHIDRKHEPPVKRFQCEICADSFISKHEIKQHMEKHRPREERSSFVCDINNCVQAFTSQSNLTRHKHTHEREFDSNLDCNICHLRFSRIDSLRRHLLVHNNTKRNGKTNVFNCVICQSKFSTQSNLYKHHERSHNAIPDGTEEE